MLNSLPIYYMSLYRMSEGVVKAIEGIQSKFLWGNSELKRKIHMISWSKIKQDWEHGGLNVRGLRDMNDALLLKWWWRFGSEKNSFWRQVVCAKYKLDSNNWLPDMEIRGNISLAWKDILLIKHRSPATFIKFMENIRWSIGNGIQTSFWSDPWANNTCLKSLFPRIFYNCLRKNEKWLR